MGLSSVMAADGSVKRKAEDDSFDDMGLPSLKPIVVRKTALNQIENSVSMEKNENEGCETPKSEEHKIISCGECPPAPRKKRAVARLKPATIPGEVFFVPQDLESVFFPYRIRPRKKLHWSAEPAWIGVSMEDKFI